MELVHQLYRKVAEAAGATPKFADSTHAIISKWLVAVGGTPKFLDSKNDLLRRVALALGKTPKPGDTFNDLLQKIAGLPPGNSEWDCLRSMVPATDEGFPGGEPDLPEEPAVPGPFFLNDVENLTDQGFSSFEFDLSWTVSANAEGYHVEVSKTEDFAEPLFADIDAGNTLSFEGIGADDSDLPLYIRIKAVNALPDVQYSNTVVITDAPAP